MLMQLLQKVLNIQVKLQGKCPKKRNIPGNYRLGSVIGSLGSNPEHVDHEI